MEKKPIILIFLVILIAAIPLVLYNGVNTEQNSFSGSDDAAGKAIEQTGYTPWFNSIWEPPSSEIESLLFSLQAAIGAIIVGFILGYYTGQNKERKKMEKELDESVKNAK